MPSLAGPYQTLTFSGNLTNGSATVTGVVDIGELAVGDYVAGTGIPLGTTIKTIDSIPFTGILTLGSKSVTGLSSTIGLTSGEIITGTGVPANTEIQSVNSVTDTITLTAFATAGGLQNLSAATTSPTITLSTGATATGEQSLDVADPTATADPDLLMATTYGEGEFAIDLAPMLFPTSVQVAGSTGTDADGNPIVTTNTPTIDGESEISGFGNTTWVTIIDETPGDPTYGQIIGGFDPQTYNNGQSIIPNASNSTDSFGNFTVPINAGVFIANGVKTVALQTTDDAGAVSNQVSYTFDLQDPNLSVLTFSTALPTTASAGQNFASPSIVVYDEDFGAINTSYNGPVTIEMVSGETGTFDSASILTVNALNGVATFTDLAIDTTGTYQLEAIGPGQNSGTSSLITIVPATPAKLVWVTQPPNEITEGVAFGASLEVLDQYGNLETGYEQDVSVSLDLNGQPDISDLGATPVLASNGIVTFSDIVINNIGDPFTLIASTPNTGGSNGSLDSMASADIDVVAPILVAGSAPDLGGSITAGLGFSVTMYAETYLGTIDTSFNGIMTLGILSGPAGATIAGSPPNPTAQAVNGVATFNNVTLDTAGNYVLEATSGNAIPGDTAPITIVAAAQAQLNITEQPPQSIVAGAGFGFEVTATDRFGNPTALTGTVSVRLVNNLGGSTLGGITTVTANSSGLATFSGLTLNKVGSGYTLEASSGALTSPVSSGITVTPASANQLVIQPSGEPPATVNAGQSFLMVVDAEDQFGNLVTSFSGPVVITSPSKLAGTTVTASGGVATFNLAIDTTGTYQIKATSTNLSSITSSSFNVVAQTPSQLIFITNPPSSLTAGTQFGFEVEAEDQYGNVATGFDGTLTAALSPNAGNATLGGAVTASASNGWPSSPA